jgi:hypothetical protein
MLIEKSQSLRDSMDYVQFNMVSSDEREMEKYHEAGCKPAPARNLPLLKMYNEFCKV